MASTIRAFHISHQAPPWSLCEMHFCASINSIWQTLPCSVKHTQCTKRKNDLEVRKRTHRFTARRYFQSNLTRALKHQGHHGHICIRPPLPFRMHRLPCSACEYIPSKACSCRSISFSMMACFAEHVQDQMGSPRGGGLHTCVRMEAHGVAWLPPALSSWIVVECQKAAIVLSCLVLCLHSTAPLDFPGSEPLHVCSCVMELHLPKF